MFFKSTIKQNIGWFDVNEGGKFSTMFEQVLIFCLLSGISDGYI